MHCCSNVEPVLCPVLLLTLLGKVENLRHRHSQHSNHHHRNSHRERHYHRYNRTSRDDNRERTNERGCKELEKFPRDLNEYRDRYFAFRDRIGKEYSELWEETSDPRSSDNRHFTERRKKTVRFDSDDWVEDGDSIRETEGEWMTLGNITSGSGGGGSGHGGGGGSRWDVDRQGSQDSQTKDSGIDTSSTFTSSEDSNRGECPKVPSSNNPQNVRIEK